MCRDLKAEKQSPSEDSSKSVDIGIDHLLPGGCRVLGELHDDEPMVVIAAGEQNRLPGLAAAAPPRRVVSVDGTPSSYTSGGSSPGLCRTREAG